MRLRDKDGNPHPRWRLIVIAISVIVIGALTFGGMVYAMSKQVSIVDGVNEEISFTTYANVTSEVLAEKGIVLGEADEIVPNLDEKIFDGAKIIISRAKNIKIVDGGNSFDKLTAKKTVEEALTQASIEVGDGTQLNVELSDQITQNMEIIINRSSQENITEEASIPFKTVKKATAKLKVGETKVTCEGVDGVTQMVFTVCYENGVEVSRELVSKTVTTKPIDKVIEYGAQNIQNVAAVEYHRGVKVSRGEEFRYSAVITVSASAYDLSYQSTGKNPGDRGYGRTATGSVAQKGSVAVDPRVIPLGSRLYVEAADGSWTYGNAVASDTGGSIKGNKIDLFMSSSSEARQFGRRTAKVYILE